MANKITTPFPEVLTLDALKPKSASIRTALFELDPTAITEVNFRHLVRIYNSTKQLDFRNRILRLLYDCEFAELHDFFKAAYKKERYLDMKAYALRGLAQFETEKEIATLLKKFNQTLAKRQETTPYNYQEYELLRGANSLPYLTKRYGYACFEQTLQQLNQQYDAMPDAFKGHFTIDELGNPVRLRAANEIKKQLEDFWESQRK